MFVLEDFLSAEDRCEIDTNNELKPLIELNNRILIFYSNVVEALSTTLDTPDAVSRFPVFLINLRILRAFHSLSPLLKKGYYVEFNSILRNCHESCFMSEYFIKNPDIAKDWFENPYQINRGGMMKNLEISKDFNEIYAKLCKYTHTDFETMIQSYIRLHPDSKGPEIFKILPFFDKNEAKYSLILELFFLHYCTTQIFHYTKQFKEIDLDFKVQWEQLHAVAEEILRKAISKM